MAHKKPAATSDVVAKESIRTEHRITVEAPPARVYEWIADVTRWPTVFEPTVHVEIIAKDQATERFRLWASVNGTVVSWTSRRELDAAAGRISFTQEISTPPVQSMSGEWIFTPVDGGTRTDLTLVHLFRAVGDDPAAEELVHRALDTNSAAELGALRRVAEFDHPPSELSFSFEDVVEADGDFADAYAFVHAAGKWPDRLPHVDAVTLIEGTDGVQDLEMVTRTGDGATHRTRSTRLCLPPTSIVYKQHMLPELLVGHSGRWTFGPGAAPDRMRIAARHSVTIDLTRIESVLGPGKTLADARTFIREALGANGRATMAHAVDPAHAAEHRSQVRT